MGGEKVVMQGGLFYGDKPLDEVRAMDQFHIRVRELVESRGLDPEAARATAIAELADVPETKVEENLAPSAKLLTEAFGTLVLIGEGDRLSFD